jgi:L-lactate dehydrogenase complex protein LldE
MNNVKGLELVPLPFAEDCCGFGGTFAVKMSDISGAMVSEKTDHVKETEAEVLVGLDMACLMNIAGNLRYRNEPVRVMHLAELLYEGVKQS